MLHSYVDSLVMRGYKQTNVTVEDLPALRENEKADWLRENAYPVSV